ncbi:MAG: 3,4-dihydroxy-2-butanone-4-phosphate synthase [Proteobacteria bacterium]|nr:3,4-dihydroxy-2-butanone-4-phosphate synthase [Pseudomonadota bacterium]
MVLEVEQAVEQLRAGRQVILVDDEDRENEGDLCMVAEKVRAEDVAFMACHGRGLICLTMTADRLRRLRLPPMAERNESRFGTCFHVSVEAREGVTTGISAADRARTIRAAVAADAQPHDLVTPGHVMTIGAREGGVLVRSGQTEGSVDLARLAGFEPAGVICEIMKDDGTMARRPDLERFARQHGLGILTIAQLIEHRLQREQQLRCVAETRAVPAGLEREFRMCVYAAAVGGVQFVALVLGQPKPDEVVLVRMHRASLLNDVLGVERGPGASKNLRALRLIEEAGCGVFVYVLPEHVDLGEQVRHFEAARTFERADPGQPPQLPELRELGLGAQLLRQLGLSRIRLMTDNPRRIVGLSGYGLNVVERVGLNRQ